MTPVEKDKPKPVSEPETHIIKIQGLKSKIEGQEKSIDELQKRLTREQTQLNRLYEDASTEIFRLAKEHVETLLLLVDQHRPGKSKCSDESGQKFDTEDPDYCLRCLLVMIKDNPAFKIQQRFTIRGRVKFLS